MGIFGRKSQIGMLKDQIQDLEAQISAFPQYGGLMTGGIVNPLSGAGGVSDKDSGFYYAPTLLYSRQELEILYSESWSCAKFIDIPVDDMFVRWREFDDIDESKAALISQREKDLRLRARLSCALKAGELYGTAFLIMVTKDAPLNAPLNLAAIREGDLVNLLVVDRYSCSVIERDYNPMSTEYGNPLIYRVTLLNAQAINVHTSRMIRFDGVRPLTSLKWSGVYERDWGQSKVIRAIRAITQEDSMAKGINHLLQECSVEHIGIDGFEDAITEAPDADLKLSERATRVSRLKSIYRTVYTDKNDVVQRLDVTFSGIADLMDRYARRLAAIADIPMTRFWGTSPVGMNATGEGDMENYAVKVASDQENKLRPALDRLDAVFMRSCGLKETPAYQFPSIADVSEEDKTVIAERKVNMAVVAVSGGVMDENEVRKIMTGDPVIGNLSDDFVPPMPEMSELVIPADEIQQTPEGGVGANDGE